VPFEHQDGGVVGEAAVLVGHDFVDQAPERLGRGLARGDGADDEVGEAVLAEARPVPRLGLGDAVGVEQDPVAGLQLDGVDPPRVPAGAVGLQQAEAERQLRRTFRQLAVATVEVSPDSRSWPMESRTVMCGSPPISEWSKTSPPRS
jgi:hypothetical protein